ncbi:MAG: hypothetical protein R3F11_06380 [Verrucomicrobiales bacterium]
MDINNSQAAIDKLKTATAGDNWREIAGLRGAMIDPRLDPKPIDDGESGERAYFNASTKRFEIRKIGPGIREFTLNENLATAAPPTEQRHQAVRLAKKDPWIWDYVDHAAPVSPGPAGGPPVTDPTTTPIDPPALGQLAPPTYSITGGNRRLRDYPLSLTLADDAANPAGASQILYSYTVGEERVYANEAILIDPTMKVEAYAFSIDPDNWGSSNTVAETYETTPEQIEIELSFPDARLDYFELGGVRMAKPGEPASTPSAAAPGLVSLLNGHDIPARYQSSANFQIYWTYDGSDPLTSTSREEGGTFDDGFPGQEIDILLAHFSAGDNIMVKAAAKSRNTALLADSKIEQIQLKAESIELPPPLISPEAGELQNDEAVTIAFDFASELIPEGARIYFNVEGVDPGDDNGEPKPGLGTEYTGAFTIDALPGSEVTVVARVYPPTGKKRWFSASRKSEVTYDIPLGNGDIYVGGMFDRAGASRNIARLMPDGRLDGRFDPGLGASQGSIIGSVLRQGGAGAVLAGGNFITVDGQPRMALSRLNAIGQVDTSFDAALE